MFQSGFTANAGTVAAILDKEDVIVSDRLNHASIIDGARLSRAEIKVFEHNDAAHADALLAETARPGRRQLLITDGVFSMDGDIAPLPDLVEVAERHGAIMMIDDAHAIGRPRRREARGPWTTSGCTAASTSRSARSRRRSACSAGSSPGPHAPDRVAREPRPAVPVLHERAAGGGRGVPRGARHHPRRARPARATVGQHDDVQGPACTTSASTRATSETPITPVITGDEETTQTFARRLFEEGVFTPPIVFPTVAGKARVRTIVTADHTEDDLREAAEAFARVGRELELIA